MVSTATTLLQLLPITLLSKMAQQVHHSMVFMLILATQSLITTVSGEMAYLQQIVIITVHQELATSLRSLNS